MTQMRLLDLFCGEGGAGYGYHQAGFDVVGVDRDPQVLIRYPFACERADALDYLKEHGHEYDVIHASPPCQAYSVTKHTHHNVHDDLVAETRDLLNKTGKPWIMENVVGAPLIAPILLCGRMFSLHAYDTDGQFLVLDRHRLFETSLRLSAPPHPPHHRGRVPVAGVYGGGSQDRAHAKGVRRGGYTPHKGVMMDLVGIDWMTLVGMTQAVPPAYTKYLGRQMLRTLRSLIPIKEGP